MARFRGYVDLILEIALFRDPLTPVVSRTDSFGPGVIEVSSSVTCSGFLTIEPNEVIWGLRIWGNEGSIECQMSWTRFVKIRVVDRS